MTGPPSQLDQRSATDPIELAPRPASAATARRRVRAFAASHRLPADVVDVLCLVSSELVTNSVLHARTALLLTLELRPGAVRISVSDRFPATPAARHYPLEAPTGRGLGVVAALSRAWGIDAVKDGKLVWAEVPLDGGVGAGPDTPPRTSGQHRAAAQPSTNAARAVRFPAVPVADCLALQEHNDALYRELGLLAVERDSGPTAGAAPPPRLRVLARRLLGPEFRDARDAQREAVAEALARGQTTVDLQARASVEAVAVARAYVALLDEADTYCRAGILLTTPPHPRVTALRHWFVEQFAAQLLEDRQPVPP